MQEQLKDIGAIIVPNKKKNHVSDKRKWLDVQRKYKRHNPKCEICGTTANIEVHHIVPVSENPSLEFEPSNLISLCRKGRNCHLVHGHLGNFNKSNPNILSLKKF
jgi:5-methylcytosine-specific restriction endonuclease McrA